MTTPKPAMTMREIREQLGHVAPGEPEAHVQTTRYVVSCLPEGHDDRFLFAVQVEYRGESKWAVSNRCRDLGRDGSWSFGFDWSGGDREPATSEELDLFDKEQQVWLADHRFDEQTALRLAKQAARLLEYRGYGVTQALAENSTP